MIEPLRVGLIGCGRISDIYIQNCQAFPEIDIVACASLDLEESQASSCRSLLGADGSLHEPRRERGTTDHQRPCPRKDLIASGIPDRSETAAVTSRSSSAKPTSRSFLNCPEP